MKWNIAYCLELRGDRRKYISITCLPSVGRVKNTELWTHAMTRMLELRSSRQILWANIHMTFESNNQFHQIRRVQETLKFLSFQQFSLMNGCGSGLCAYCKLQLLMHTLYKLRCADGFKLHMYHLTEITISAVSDTQSPHRQRLVQTVWTEASTPNICSLIIVSFLAFFSCIDNMSAVLGIVPGIWVTVMSIMNTALNSTW